ncbi:MAG: hypothetical protein K1X94_18155 [Sandaracinaceae bacterium]|nr:hypothetical protein [Sandaracinaceae bacterium]
MRSARVRSAALASTLGVLALGVLALGVLALLPARARAVRAVLPTSATLEVEATAATPDPDLPAEVMLRMVRTRRLAFLRCYDLALRAHPSLGSGEIAMGVVVAAGGASSTASVTRDGLGEREVSDCAVRVVQGFRFNPGPRAPARFEVRLRYERVRPHSNPR